MIWTFGRKVVLGFGLALVVLLAIGFIGYRSIDSLLENNARVTHTHVVLDRITALLIEMRDAETGQRGFIITADDAFLEPHTAASIALPSTLADLRRLTAENPRQSARLDEMEVLIQRKLAEMKGVLDERRAHGLEAAQRIVADGAGKRIMDDIRRLAAQMEQDEREQLKTSSAATEANAEASKRGVALAALLGFFVVALAATLITRSLSSQLSAFVNNIRSSSTELQAAAAQQASGSREQLSATSEVATTIRELLATSRQITESAQRVASAAEQTATGARAGTSTMQLTGETIQAIKRQMDLVVGHMLDLGRKSQQAGGILEVVNELAEQTNILAINATIEAAGAGEAGRRFSVVADEIRKLADRVGGSTKEIRTLIDDMRAAVNTTVMATESGVKAVDAGTARFADVTSAFGQIASLVGTTTDAAREIELNTKQQATAVEQVSTAIGNVAQATREADASAKQTLDAAGAAQRSLAEAPPPRRRDGGMTEGRVLALRAGTVLAGLPLEHVVETMRPLATRPVAMAPPYVLGAAVVRGEAVPVVELARLLAGAAAPIARWVTVHAGGRTVALAVGEVLGVRQAGPSRAPALFAGVKGNVLDGLGVLDRELLVVLASARLVGEDAWKAFDDARVAS